MTAAEAIELESFVEHSLEIGEESRIRLSESTPCFFEIRLSVLQDIKIALLKYKYLKTRNSPNF